MSDREIVLPKGSEDTYRQLKFAPGVRVDGTVYCSGQIGVGADGKLPDDPEAQFVNAFEGVKDVLEAAGASFDDVVELLTFHVDFNDHLGTFMKVKDRYISEPYPAWTAIGVSALAFGSLVEIKATAVRR